jgi:hypothetical protein
MEIYGLFAAGDADLAEVFAVNNFLYTKNDVYVTKRSFVMKKFIGVFCVVSAVWVVGCAALEAAQDQGSAQMHFKK